MVHLRIPSFFMVFLRMTWWCTFARGPEALRHGCCNWSYTGDLGKREWKQGGCKQTYGYNIYIYNIYIWVELGNIRGRWGAVEGFSFIGWQFFIFFYVHVNTVRFVWDYVAWQDRGDPKIIPPNVSQRGWFLSRSGTSKSLGFDRKGCSWELGN